MRCRHAAEPAVFTLRRGTDGLMMGAPPEMMLDMMRSEAGARRRLVVS